jgi:hypothetical protein
VSVIGAVASEQVIESAACSQPPVSQLGNTVFSNGRGLKREPSCDRSHEETTRVQECSRLPIVGQFFEREHPVAKDAYYRRRIADARQGDFAQSFPRGSGVRPQIFVLLSEIAEASLTIPIMLCLQGLAILLAKRYSDRTSFSSIPSRRNSSRARSISEPPICE